MAYIDRMFRLVDPSAAEAALERRLEAIVGGEMRRKVILVVNGKGGVGKSSVAASLAYALSAARHRVLLIEMDEQGNNCEDFGITGTELDDHGAAQAKAILAGEPLVPTGEARPNLYVVPGGEHLEAIVEELYVQRRYAGYLAADNPEYDADAAWMSMYAAAIDAVRDEYDVILLDVAPGSEVLQLAALVAGDMVIIPSKSDTSSRKGLRLVAERFQRAARINPWLRLLGVVLFATNKSATKVHESIRNDLASDLQGAAPVFNQSIRHVEAAAVQCRSQGKLPQEAHALKDIDTSLRKSIEALAGDYQSLGMETLQMWAAVEKRDAEDAA